MRKGQPKELVARRNLSIPGREVAKLDFLRRATEASSDSEVVRQALRHLEQLVEDEKRKILLKAVDDGGERLLSSDRFRDQPGQSEELTRRSLILHDQSEKRLGKLQAAMGSSDPSEVVRCALRLYEEIVTAAVGGADFFAEFPSGERYGVRFGSFASAEPPSAPAAARAAIPRPAAPRSQAVGGRSN